MFPGCACVHHLLRPRVSSLPEFPSSFSPSQSISLPRLFLPFSVIHCSSSLTLCFRRAGPSVKAHAHKVWPETAGLQHTPTISSLCTMHVLGAYASLLFYTVSSLPRDTAGMGLLCFIPSLCSANSSPFSSIPLFFLRGFVLVFLSSYLRLLFLSLFFYIFQFSFFSAAIEAIEAINVLKPDRRMCMVHGSEVTV